MFYKSHCIKAVHRIRAEWVWFEHVDVDADVPCNVRHSGSVPGDLNGEARHLLRELQARAEALDHVVGAEHSDAGPEQPEARADRRARRRRARRRGRRRQGRRTARRR